MAQLGVQPPHSPHSVQMHSSLHGSVLHSSSCSSLHPDAGQLESFSQVSPLPSFLSQHRYLVLFIMGYFYCINDMIHIISRTDSMILAFYMPLLAREKNTEMNVFDV